MLKPRLLTKALKPPALLATLKRRKMLHSMDTATRVTIRERTSLKGQRQVQRLQHLATTCSVLPNMATFKGHLGYSAKKQMRLRKWNFHRFLHRYIKPQPLHNLS